ncbi:MAG: FHA domain-containing protein [Candidatus Binataceae bacterium]
MALVIDRRDLTFKSLAGLAGGAIGWLPVELANSGHSLTDPGTETSFILGMVSMALLSGMIGGMINAAQAQMLELTPQVKRCFLIGFVTCSVLSLPATYYSNLAFTYILEAGGWQVGHPGGMGYLILARLVGWMLMGLMLGAGVGLATLSPPNIPKGALGGLVGGFLGGITFDLISNITSGGLFSRLFGLSMIGLAIGLFIGLVQELTKAAWLKVEAGRLRGREFRLEKPVATIGRAEESEIGLFGDPAVAPRHAVIQRNGADFVLKDLTRDPGTFVNGKRVETAPLHHGDVIGVGGYRVRFNLRNAPPIRAAVTQEPVTAHRDGANAPCLVDSEGRHLQLSPGVPIRIGRSADNDLVVPHQSISRHHATIAMVNGVFRLQDLGSQNGTYVGGQRVSEAPLKDGDLIRLGEAQFQFRG